MYNEEQKRRYISEQIENSKRARTCEQVFEALAPYEEEWGADFSTRSPEELRPIFEQIAGLRERVRMNYMIIIRNYIKWLIGQGDNTVQRGILSIDTLGLGNIRNMTVKNPVHLQQCLNEIFEPETEQMVSNIHRCFYWLAYAGLREQDILSVKCSDVDLDHLTVTFGGETYRIYEEGLLAFRNAATLPTFVYKNSNYTADKKIITRIRAQGDTLIRGFTSKPTSKGIRGELSHRTKDAIDSGRTKMKLSHHRVQISGIFYRMYEREVRGLPVDFSEDAARFMEHSVERRKGESYKLDSGRNTIEAKQRQIERDYMRDYERWKVAWVIL